jgi:hypothetical protein
VTLESKPKSPEIYCSPNGEQQQDLFTSALNIVSNITRTIAATVAAATVGCSQRVLEGLFLDVPDIILVDVQRLCLVRANTSHKYLALSYVWGGVKQVRTTKSTVDELQNPYSLEKIWEKLPQVIRHAIDFTASMRHQYLWIDSLCIVQDNEQTKHIQLERMAHIYENAIITLVACSGQNSNSPLLESPSEGQSAMPTLPDTFQRTSDAQQIFRDLDNAPWSHRGWTYEEHRLSRRRVYFFRNGIYFHCRRELFEPTSGRTIRGIPPRTHDSRRGWAGISSGYRDQLGITNFTPAIPHGYMEWPKMKEDDWGTGFKVWARMVREYSHRSLTVEDDVLRAFIGILSAFQAHSSWPMIHGIPQPLLDFALCWTPTTFVTRRRSIGFTSPFPSWSWLAWSGGITFDLLTNRNQFVVLSSCIKSVEVECRVDTDKNKPY